MYQEKAFVLLIILLCSSSFTSWEDICFSLLIARYKEAGPGIVMVNYNLFSNTVTYHEQRFYERYLCVSLLPLTSDDERTSNRILNVIKMEFSGCIKENELFFLKVLL